MNPHDSPEADRPITKPEEDRLGRKSFAAHVAKMLVRTANEDPIVVGLYGPWGAGKTSVLNLITKEIQGAEGVAVVHFNPWFFTGEAQLLERFFGELAATLGSKAVPARQEAANALRKYLGVLKPAIKIASFAADAFLPGAGMAARAITEVAVPSVEGLTTAAEPVADALSRDVSLEDTRDVVSSKLRAADVRIVVLIDDIDRLYPDDIRTVFKLVRLVGDLPRVSYLLSFDPDVVALSLTRSDTEENAIAKGHAYLEKIVQVALPLPNMRQADLRKTAFEGLVDIFKKQGVELTENERQRLADGWGLGIEQNVKTIRQAKRILNAVQFAIGLLKDEVNAVDVVLMEALRIVYPRIVSAISSDPTQVLTSSKSRRTEQKLLPVESEVAKLSESERQGVSRLLELLFPRLKKNYSYSESFDVEWRQERRVASGEHLEKALGYGVPAGIISDATYDEMMRELRGLKDDRFLLLLQQLVKDVGWGDLIWRFRQDLSSLPEVVARKLALVVVQRASELKNGGSFIGDARNAALFIKEVMFRTKSEVDARALGFELIKKSGTIYFAALILERLSAAKDDYGALPPGWNEVVGAARSTFKDRMAAEFDISQAVGELNRDALLVVLYQWAESAGRQSVESVLEQWFAKDAQGAKRLVATVIPLLRNDGFKSPMQTLSVQSGYGNLRAIVSPAFIVRALGYDPEKPIPQEDLEKVFELSHQDQAALLFAEMHQKTLTAERSKA